MSNKLTIIKVLPRDGELSPSQEDLERWRQKFAKAEVTLEEAAATGEVEIQTLAEKAEGEHYLTVVKVGSETFSPNFTDLEQWRQIFTEAANDPDFKIFTHSEVEIDIINIGKIINVE